MNKFLNTLPILPLALLITACMDGGGQGLTGSPIMIGDGSGSGTYSSTGNPWGQTSTIQQDQTFKETENETVPTPTVQASPPANTNDVIVYGGGAATFELINGQWKIVDLDCSKKEFLLYNIRRAGGYMSTYNWYQWLYYIQKGCGFTYGGEVSAPSIIPGMHHFPEAESPNEAAQTSTNFETFYEIYFLATTREE